MGEKEGWATLASWPSPGLQGLSHLEIVQLQSEPPQRSLHCGSHQSLSGYFTVLSGEQGQTEAQVLLQTMEVKVPKR